MAGRRAIEAAATLAILGGFVLFAALYTRNVLLSPGEIVALHAYTTEPIRGTTDRPFDRADPAPASGRSTARSNALNRFVAGLATFSLQVFGRSPLTLRLPAFVAFGALLAAVFLFVRQRASGHVALWAVLAILATDLARYGFDYRSAALEGALAALALVCWQSFAGQRRPWWLIGMAAALGYAVWFDSRAGFVALILLAVLLADAVRARRLESWTAVALCAAAVFFAFIASRAPGAILQAPARALAAPVAALKQPFYAVAFVQSTYGRLFGIMTPFLLLLGGAALVGRTRSSSQGDDRGVSPFVPAREHFVLAALATLPLWAFAPAWMIARDTPGDALWFAAVGCAIWLAYAGANVTAGSRLARWLWTAILLSAAAINLALGDPASLSTRDLAQRRGRFALLDWQDRIEAPLPIVVPDRAVYLHLAEYAPRGLADRLVHVSTRDGLASFLSHRQSFFVFEAAEIRSPMFGWLAEWNPTLTASSSWTPKDLSLEAPAYLYRVDLPSSPSSAESAAQP